MYMNSTSRILPDAALAQTAITTIHYVDAHLQIQKNVTRDNITTAVVPEFVSRERENMSDAKSQQIRIE